MSATPIAPQMYPTKKVLCVFLLSPIVPSTLIWLFASFLSVKAFNVEELVSMFLMLLVFNLFGILIGVVPALLTGLTAVTHKLKRNLPNILLLSLVGFISTVLMIKALSGNTDSGYGFIGAACALMIAVFVLPKKGTSN